YLWYYRSSSKNLTNPYLGIVNLLEDLEKNKIKMAVLSNKPDPETKEVVNHYFPHIAFSCVIGKKAEFPIKPNPASLEYVISELKTSKERILYVGDTGTDMETAANASLVSAGVLWGFRDKVELQGSGANYIIEKPEEISFLILGG
ncbi:MAG: HAD family hydrolase, partial [Bacilli bacterium]|nr:HAD family hydrolase [Bacilli bacterium]